ncbi:MAG: phytanoyl-CoA dioxygenase family protein [Candidatus Omnitrophota bacterium]|nr:phytanoyl-CoA dioxygenase family protein [Candidatus Omnitrophota bacterium]
MSSTLDFDPKTLPWFDKDTFDSDLPRRVRMGQVTPREAVLLRQWRRDGFVILRGVVEHDLIDRMLADYERAWEERPVCRLLVQGEGLIWLRTARPRSEYPHHHYRLLDFHNLSDAAASIMLHPGIARFLSILFDDIPRAMQTLFFEYSSEQKTHQDFAYVQSGILSHLAASWVACDDADEENGAVYYYAGSHRIQKFDFGDNSITLHDRDFGKAVGFEQYVEAQCLERDQEKRIVCLKKGDVLLWHSALVHGGGLARNREKKRRSLVSHYTSSGAYPRDRRHPHVVPTSIALNGGLYYACEYPGHVEGVYRA